MAETREYVIPLRKEWAKVPRYKRTAKSVKAVKEFIARHMRIRDRDTKKVKLDVYLNNKLFFRGFKKPLTKIKVRAEKDGDNVKVELVEIPESVKFSKLRHEKRHKKAEKKKELEKPKEEEKKEEKTEEEKKEEKEKAKSVEQAQIKAAEQTARIEKHTTKSNIPTTQRKALKK